MEIITCKTVSVFDKALTIGGIYEVIEIDDVKEQVKIKGNNNKIRWFPMYCFDMEGKVVPTISEILIVDSLDNIGSSSIEVELVLSTSEKRWCYFVTPEILKISGDNLAHTDIKIHFGSPHMIIVSIITKEVIEKTLRYIESQGEIFNSTLLIE